MSAEGDRERRRLAEHVCFECRAKCCVYAERPTGQVARAIQCAECFYWFCASCVVKHFKSVLLDAHERLEQEVKRLREALAKVQPIVCSMACPSVKRTGERWTHAEFCRDVKALASAAPGEERGR